MNRKKCVAFIESRQTIPFESLGKNERKRLRAYAMSSSNEALSSLFSPIYSSFSFENSGFFTTKSGSKVGRLFFSVDLNSKFLANFLLQGLYSKKRKKFRGKNKLINKRNQNVVSLMPNDDQLLCFRLIKKQNRASLYAPIKAFLYPKARLQHVKIFDEDAKKLEVSLNLLFKTSVLAKGKSFSDLDALLSGSGLSVQDFYLKEYPQTSSMKKLQMEARRKTAVVLANLQRDFDKKLWSIFFDDIRLLQAIYTLSDKELSHLLE